MAENLTWQQVRDGAAERDPATLVAQVTAWFELLPLYQWASLAHADLKKAIEDRARALGKPFTIDHAVRVLGDLGGEVKALRDWLEGQSFAGAGRLRAAVEAHLASGAPTTTPAASAPQPAAAPAPEPVVEAPKPKEEAKAKDEPKKEEAKKEEPKKEEAKKDEPKKDEPKAKEEPPKDEAKKDEAKAATSDQKPKDEPKKDAPATDEKKSS